MGDEIATYSNLILERRPPLSGEETLRVLDMMGTAFRQPASIRLCANRNPKISRASGCPASGSSGSIRQREHRRRNNFFR
jgi:hypothetical protein